VTITSVTEVIEVIGYQLWRGCSGGAQGMV
jgi:hypothetical protein